MGMRNDDNPNEITVELGSSENQAIVMFNNIRGFDHTNYDNPKLLDKIVEFVKKDFVAKCLMILKTSGKVPESLYTYDMFNKMFAINQCGDVTTSKEKKVYSFLISNQQDIEEIVLMIRDNFNASHYKFQDDVSETDVRRMFQGGEFPFLKVKYAWHGGTEEWHFAYYITR